MYLLRFFLAIGALMSSLWLLALAGGLLVGLHNAGDELVANDVAFVHLYEGNAGHVLQDALRLNQTAALRGGQVDLRAVARDNHLRVPAHAGEEHFDLRGGGVLRFVEYDHGVVERAASHEGERGNLYDLRVHVLLQFGGGYHFLQSIVEGLQVGVNLVAHVAGQEAQLFAGLHGGAAQNDALHLLSLEGAHGQGYGGVGFARACGTYGKEHVTLGVSLHQAALVGRAGRDGLAARAVDDDALRLVARSAALAHNGEQVLLVEAVEAGAVAVELQKHLVEVRHVLLATYNPHHIVARHDAHFGKQGPEHAQVGIAGAEEDGGVGALEYEMFFCHETCGEKRPPRGPCLAMAAKLSIMPLRRNLFFVLLPAVMRM